MGAETDGIDVEENMWNGKVDCMVNRELPADQGLRGKVSYGRAVQSPPTERGCESALDRRRVPGL